MLVWMGVVLAQSAGPVGVGFAEAVALGGDSAAQVVIARSRSREVQARRDEIAGARLPKLELDGSQVYRSYNFLTGGIAFPGMEPRVPFYSIQEVKAKASMPVLSFELSDRIRETERSIVLRNREADQVREAARFQAGAAWIELARAQALLSDRKAGLELSRELGRITDDQHRVGAATGLDMVRAEGQMLQAERACSLAEQVREKAASALAALLGISAMDSVHALGGLPLEAGAATGIVADTASAQVLAARAGLDLARTSEESSRHARIPRIGVAADYGISGRHLADDGEWVGSVGVFATWEIWDGGAERSRREQARERVLQAARSLSQARRDAAQNLSESRRTVDLVARALELSKRVCAMADSELVLSRQRFEGGASGNLEVVQAQASRNQAHAAWIESAAAYQVAVLRLRWIAGDWRGL